MPRRGVIIRTKIGRAPTNRNQRPAAKNEMDVAGISMDQTITKYCGVDWLDKLEQITGSCTTIDLETYKKAIADVVICEKNIKTLLKRVIKQAFGQDIKEVSQLFENFNTLSTSLMIGEKSVIRKLKNTYKGKKGAKPTVLTENNSTECVADEYLPMNLVKTDWYKCIKKMEQTIYRIMEKLFVSPDGESKNEKTSSKRKNMYKDHTYENFQEILKKHPDMLSVYAPFSVQMTSQSIFDSMIAIQRYANAAINIIMTPMYDVKTKITKSYEKTLAGAFRSEIASGHVTKDLVISLLSDFIIAKYRATLTGSNKYMLQMLSNEITEGQLAGIDGARFADIMETIDVDAIDRDSKVASFATKAKDLLRTLSTVKEDKFDMKMLTDVKELLGDDPGETVTSLLAEVPDDVAQDLAKYESILDTPEKIESEEDDQ